MDQIFDRLEQLFKSWTAPDADTRHSGGRSSSYGDPDLDAAMSELDDFLDKDREAAEARTRAREAERLAWEKREREARARAQGGSPNGGTPYGGSPLGDQGHSSGPPLVVVNAYKTLGLPFGSPQKDVKAAYKKLLLKYHPDRNSGSPADLKRATEISATINAAYQIVETWTTTGRVSSE